VRRNRHRPRRPWPTGTSSLASWTWDSSWDDEGQRPFYPVEKDWLDVLLKSLNLTAPARGCILIRSMRSWWVYKGTERDPRKIQTNTV